MTLVIWTIEVPAIPATNKLCKLVNARKEESEAYVGKMMVWRIIWQLLAMGMSTVSVPEQGAPPTKVLSFVDVQQRWHIFPAATFPGSEFAAFPATMRKPYDYLKQAIDFWRKWLTFLNAVTLLFWM
jgi:hypothetical protein